MQIGDMVAVERGGARRVGVVSRADGWNGLWVLADGIEEPLGMFVSGGRLVEAPRPTVEEREESLAGALLVAIGAFAVLALGSRLAFR